METWRTKFCSVVSEFEGTLLNNKNTFSYFMLLAFDASGLLRFAFLLFLWPVIALIDVFGYENASLRLMTFVAFVGLRENNIKHMAKIILPKFYMDDLTVATWTVFGSCTKKVVVTRMPRVMVEWFAKEHLGADEVIGPELDVNRFGFLTGFLRETDIDQCNLNRVASFFVDHKPYLGLGRPVSTSSTTFMSLCEEQILDPINPNRFNQQLEIQLPKPVIFHAARFVNLPTPATSLLILLWIPFGILLAATRIIIGSILPIWIIPYIIGLSGVRVIVKGEPPIEKSDDNLLFVCNHRTMIDPVLISYVLGRRVPAVTSNVSRFYDILTPVPIVRFTKNRDIDAVKMKQELSKGDLVLCPEGTFCFQPFVFRFSAMFAEVTDKIVPVAIDCKVGLFQNPIRTWDGLDMIILFMNPIIVYEVTFLNQLPTEETCLSGKSSYEVANHVQRILADTLGFECTNLGRKHESMFVLEGYKKSH